MVAEYISLDLTLSLSLSFSLYVGKVFDNKMEPKRYPKQPKSEAKTSQGTSKGTLAAHGRKSIEKGCQKTSARVPILGSKPIKKLEKHHPAIHSKNSHGGT